jgi:hypothetical protein
VPLSSVNWYLVIVLGCTGIGFVSIIGLSSAGLVGIIGLSSAGLVLIIGAGDGIRDTGSFSYLFFASDNVGL